MIRKVLVLASALGALSSAIACSSQTDSPAPAASVQAKKTTVTPDVLQHGKGIYKVNCAPCHGETGKGDGPAAAVFKPAPADHTNPDYMNKLTDEEIGKVIQMGGAVRGKPLMPSNPQIKEGDLAALVAFTRSLSTGQP